MGRRGRNESEARFEAYVDGLVSVIGHADRAGPLSDYCMGLMLPAERKSVEPMAALTAPDRTAAQHQKLLHFVGQAPWSDDVLLDKVREMVLPRIERHGPIEAWIIDDTGFPKKGRHSVGVARQYCGQLGKQDNCQVAVSLSLANHHRVCLKVGLPERDPSVPTLTTLWSTANWQERETYDMLGITFTGHPGLYRILMPDEWEGFPQRKDVPLGYEEVAFSFNQDQVYAHKPFAKE